MQNTTIKSTKYVTRKLLARLCNKRDIRIAVEVGTDQGVYAREFLRLFRGDHLFCIDPYLSYEWEGITDRLPDMLTAAAVLAPYAGRARIIRGKSPAVIEGLPWWVRDHLGFVYIDGDHSYEAVATDIAAWWPILSEVGVLAGHDYDDTHPGVIQAVNEFAGAVGRQVYLTGSDALPSWYIYKNNEPCEQS